MQEITEKKIVEALSRIKDPESGRDIVAAGWVGEVLVQAERISLTIHLPKNCNFPQAELKSACVGAIKQKLNVKVVLVNFSNKPQSKTPHVQDNQQIQHIIAVGSGKGGVGKSTCSVNLAYSMAQLGFRVGLLDADIYGPSVPTMLSKALPEGELTEHVQVKGEKLIPFDLFGMKVMSVAMLIEKDQPTVWRAPIATKMLNQFLNGVEWGEPDFLFIDLPPGTGDIQLTLAQQANLTGALIVTTPQKVALNIAKKGLLMFQGVKVPVLGLLETMSGFACGNCQTVTSIFGEGGADQLAQESDIPVLAKVPLDAAIVQASDSGEPLAIFDSESVSANAYLNAARELADRVNARSKDAEIVPLAVESEPEQDHNTVSIYWSDGQKWKYNAQYLRGSCPCAVCVDEISGERKVFPKDISDTIYLEEAKPVGRYGLNLIWSDRHTSGIFTFSYLRELEAIKTKEYPRSH